MSTAAARAGRAGPIRRPRRRSRCPAARALAFLALCGFAALQWMQMLEPAAGQRAGYAVLAAARRDLRPAARRAGCPGGRAPPRPCSSRSARFALALLAGGVADEQLLPDRWGELAAGIGRGIVALPGARVPVPRPGRVDARW